MKRYRFKYQAQDGFVMEEVDTFTPIYEAVLECLLDAELEVLP